MTRRRYSFSTALWSFGISSLLLATHGLSFGQVSQRAGLAPSSTRIVESIDEANLVQLQGNTHPVARSDYDQGAVPDDFAMEHLLLQLKRSPEQEERLEQLIDELHDRQSPRYHRWLTADQLGAEFGPAQQDLEVVANWLQRHGFKINVVYSSGTAMDVSGTAGQVRDTFHTEIHNYNFHGVQHIANATDPQIPAALAPLVIGFVSLHDFMSHPIVRRRTPLEPLRSGNPSIGVGPDFSFSHNGTEQYDVGPQDFAALYNVKPLWTASTPITGKGQTIALIGNSDMQAADWRKFRTTFGLSSFSGTLTQVHPAPRSGTNNCSDPGRNTSEFEVALDTEWSSAVAPDAAIELNSCANTQTTDGLLIAAQNVVNGTDPPPIISVSYANCESDLGASGNAAWKSVWQQAVAEGISVFVGSGDAGAAGCDEFFTGARYATHGIAVSGLSSTPYDVSVGGTDFQDYADGTISTYWSTTNGSGRKSVKSYVPEMTWNGSCASSVLYTFAGYSSGAAFCNSSVGASYLSTSAGSGAPSSVYSKPSWQSGVYGIHNDGKRDLPDVSLFAADGSWTHSLSVCMSDSAQGGYPCDYMNPTDAWFNSGGGTSFATPAFAGVQALIDQKVGSKQGNPNSVLYRLAATEYGSPSAPNRTNLESCNATNGKAVGKSCIFYDVTKGDIDVPCQAGTKACNAPAGDTYGVLSTSTTSLHVAYPATAGWDFATGLGTVNVTNLINSW